MFQIPGSNRMLTNVQRFNDNLMNRGRAIATDNMMRIPRSDPHSDVDARTPVMDTMSSMNSVAPTEYQVDEPSTTDRDLPRTLRPKWRLSWDTKVIIGTLLAVTVLQSVALMVLMQRFSHLAMALQSESAHAEDSYDTEVRALVAMARGSTMAPKPARPLPEVSVPPHWPCEEGEELFGNLCYRSCTNITKGEFTWRQDGCTCCKTRQCPREAGEFLTYCPVLNRNNKGTDPAGPRLINCTHPNEELFMNLCYIRCSILTNGRFPVRTGMNTCSNERPHGNWTMGFGVCSGFAVGYGIGGLKCLPSIPMPLIS